MARETDQCGVETSSACIVMENGNPNHAVRPPMRLPRGLHDRRLRWSTGSLKSLLQ